MDVASLPTECRFDGSARNHVPTFSWILVRDISAVPALRHVAR